MMDIRCPPHTLQTFSRVVTYSIYLQGRSLGPTSIEKKATSLGTVQSWVWGWVPGKCHRRGACAGAADTLPSNYEREREREREGEIERTKQRRCRKAKRRQARCYLDQSSPSNTRFAFPIVAQIFLAGF
jgi:hypothetical protein